MENVKNLFLKVKMEPNRPILPPNGVWRLLGVLIVVQLTVAPQKFACFYFNDAYIKLRPFPA